MITTLYVHRRPVTRPAEFTAHRMQRMFLTRRHATRMTLPEPIEERRERQLQPTRYASDTTVPATRNWSGLASVLLMVALVVAAVAVTGLRGMGL